MPNLAICTEVLWRSLWGPQYSLGLKVAWENQIWPKDSPLKSATPPLLCSLETMIVFSWNKMAQKFCSWLQLISLFNSTFPELSDQRQNVFQISFKMFLLLWADSFLTTHIPDCLPCLSIWNRGLGSEKPIQGFLLTWLIWKASECWNSMSKK